jgi:hypothetical protein
MYSCNCGWIDWTHAGPWPASGILENVGAAQIGNWPPNHYKFIPNIRVFEEKPIEIPIDYRDVGTGIYYPMVTTVKLPTIFAGVTGNVLVSMNLLNPQEEWEVSLGIYISIQNAFETWQGGTPGVVGTTRGAWGGLFDQSSFSEEDLLSNLIGFHRALLTHRTEGAMNDEDTKWHFMKLCGVVGVENLDISDINDLPSEFKQTHRDIYETYMNSGGFDPVRQWGRPCLGRLSGLNCPDAPKVPSELVRLHPESPTPNGK